jgi:MazG family protein
MDADPKEPRHRAETTSLGPQGIFASDTAVLDRALVLVEYLRAHCDWDRRQTARTLVPHLIEEIHEVVAAIHSGDTAAIRDELGDVLLNLAFQIVVAEASDHFSRDEVVLGLEQKMVQRHPELFEGGMSERWEAIKAKDRTSGTLEGLSRSLDPLLRAHRIQERVSGVGFDWDQPRGAIEKVREELLEVEAALESEGEEAVKEEIGDLLFSVVNLARLVGSHGSLALEAANAKFEKRFRALETLAQERGVALPGATLAELDELWEEIKRQSP